MDQSLQKKFTSKRWLILIASCLINLCIGSVYRSTGDYHPAFLIAMCLAGVGIVLSLLYRRLTRR